MLLLWENYAKNGHVFYNRINNTTGHNTYIRGINRNTTIHAEMDCISNMIYKMSKYRIRTITTDILVLNVSRQGKLKNSQPCFNCAKILYKQKRIKIRNLYFSNDDGEIECHNFDKWFNTTNHTISSGWKHMNEKHVCK